ncbi:MAG: hypothetical protein ACP5NC_04535 [Nitrososphaeria archaeon]
MSSQMRQGILNGLKMDILIKPEQDQEGGIKKVRDASCKKEYGHLINEKIDIVNKIGSCLVNNFSLVSFQNDSVHSWSKRFGRRVQNS